jgi:hypothetical protein
MGIELTATAAAHRDICVRRLHCNMIMNHSDIG